MADRKHPTPWRVQARWNRTEADQAGVVSDWYGDDAEADSFAVVDRNGAHVRDGFTARNDALGWALVNVADPAFA